LFRGSISQQKINVLDPIHDWRFCVCGERRGGVYLEAGASWRTD
jgi:hypothetical protein